MALKIDDTTTRRKGSSRRVVVSASDQFTLTGAAAKPAPQNIPTKISLYFEQSATADGFAFIAGVDEVGRGCLAGPVVAAAVILDLSKPLPKGIDDSKKLTAKKRLTLAEQIKENALAYSIQEISAEEIDRINILQATKKAMRACIENLNPCADYLLLDAVKLADVSLPQKSIIKGDATSFSIAAASIIAKVFRDELMCALDSEFPEYGFANHFGYGTREHLEAIRKHGATAIHRKSFRGVLNEQLSIPFTAQVDS